MHVKHIYKEFLWVNKIFMYTVFSNELVNENYQSHIKQFQPHNQVNEWDNVVSHAIYDGLIINKTFEI